MACFRLLGSSLDLSIMPKSQSRVPQASSSHKSRCRSTYANVWHSISHMNPAWWIESFVGTIALQGCLIQGRKRLLVAQASVET